MDLSQTRIPNFLIVSGILSGLFYRILYLGNRDYILIVLGIAIPVILFFPLFICRAMGAGDIKLMAVTGTFFTIQENLKCIIVTIILGGVMALIKILLHKNLKKRIKHMYAYFSNMFKYTVAGSSYTVPYMDISDENMIKEAGIKFSIPILLAAIIVMGGKI